MRRNLSPIILLLAVALAAAPQGALAKRHAHHGGWMHARIAAVRGWFRHAVHDAPPTRHWARRRSRSSADARAAEQAALAARRRSEVGAYLLDHPAYSTAE